MMRGIMASSDRAIHKARIRIKRRRYRLSSILPALRFICTTGLIASLILGAYKYLANPLSVEALEFTTHSVGSSGGSIGVLGTAAADMNGDGRVDIVTAGKDGIKVFTQNDQKKFTVEELDGIHAERVYLVDLNNDGRKDILVSLQDSPGAKWYRNEGENEYTGFTIGSGSSGLVAAGDLDKDGAIDVVTATIESELVVLRRWMNNGDGVFSSTILSSDSGVRALAVGDVNSNGFPDIVTGGSQGLQRWDTSNGSTWSRVDVNDGSTNQNSIAIGDVNGDEKTDIVTGSQGGNVVVLYRNQDNSSYEKIQFDGDADAATVVLADLDEDGDLDVVVAAQDDNSVYWFVNNGSEGFSKKTLATDLQSVFSVTVSDIDGDDDLDFIAGDHFRGNLNWYERIRSKPVATKPGNIKQSTNGNGIITFDTTISDEDFDPTRIRVQYSKDGVGWDKPWITKVAVSKGSVDLKNSNGYQIGTSNPIDTDTNNEVTVTITWDTKSVENTGGPITGDVSTMQLRIIPRDATGNGATAVSSKFRIDNEGPKNISGFTIASTTANSATLNWNKPSDSSAYSYSIYYGTDAAAVKAGTSSVLTSATEAELGDVDTTSFTVGDLNSDKTYSFKLVVKDAYGNESEYSTISGLISANRPTPLPTTAPVATPVGSATPVPTASGAPQISSTPLIPTPTPSSTITPIPTLDLPTPPPTSKNNGLPVASAGVDQVVNPSALVILDGTKSTDPDNDPLVYSWRQVAGPKVTILSDRTATPSFSAGSENETYIFTLTVRDPHGASATDSVTVATRELPDTSVATVDVNTTDATKTPTATISGNEFLISIVKSLDMISFALAALLTLISLAERLIKNIKERNKGGSLANDATNAPKGKVIHYKTGEAIAEAQILVYGADGKLRTTLRTNDKGEFPTLFPAGEYTIGLQAPGFTFAPTASAAFKPETGILYTGGKITIQDGSKPIEIVIPVKPTGQEVGSIRVSLLQAWQLVQRLGRMLSWPIFLFGALLNTGLIFWMPNAQYLIIEVLYVVLVIVKVALEIRIRPAYGIVRDAITHVPLDLAVVRLYEQGTNRLVMTRVTNTQGKFFALPSAGTYTVTITKPGYAVFSKANVVITSEQDSALQITSDLMPVTPAGGLMQARASVL